MSDNTELTKVTLELILDEGVDVETVGQSFLALDKEYKHYVKKEFGTKKPYPDDKLILGNVKEGSQIYEFFSNIVLGGGLLFAERFTTLSDFFVYLRTILVYLRNPRENDKPELEVMTLENIITLMNLVSKPDQQINITINAPINNSPITINGRDARVIQANAGEELSKILEPQIREEDGQFILFTQLNKNLKTKSGNKAIAPTISPSQRDVVFASEEVKKDVLLIRESNPLLIGFQVDLEVIQIEGKPDMYNVINIRGTLDAPAGGE